MRFRLRTVFVVIAVLSVVFWVVAEATRDWRCRRQITLELTSLGACYVGFDDSGNPTWVSFVGRIRSASISRYKTLQHVDLAHSAVRDEDLRLLIGLPELFAIHLTDTAIGDAGIQHLARIESLQIIRLENTMVTDAAIDTLVRMPALRAVDVSNTRVTSSGIATLKARRPDVVVRNVRDAPDRRNSINKRGEAGMCLGSVCSRSRCLDVCWISAVDFYFRFARAHAQLDLGRPACYNTEQWFVVSGGFQDVDG